VLGEDVSQELRSTSERQPHASRSPTPKIIQPEKDSGACMPFESRIKVFAGQLQHVQHQAQRQCACYMRGTVLVGTLAPQPRNLHPVSRTWLKPIEDQTKATRPCSSGFPVCWRKAIIQRLERLFYDDDDFANLKISQERQILPTRFES
jgi:hypothetical protein